MGGFDLRTPIEKEREAQHSEICKMYAELLEKCPKASPNRLFTVIASRTNRSVPGVRGILIQHMLYQPR
jgi:hypothetical protein